MRVLLDNCILTELRHPRGNPAIKLALNAYGEDDLFLSVVTLGRIARSIGLLHTPKRPALTEWLVGLEGHFAQHILPIDLETAQLWGSLASRVQAAGLTISDCDGLIAATALRHGLHLMTRKTKAFTATGVLIIDPWNPRG